MNADKHPDDDLDDWLDGLAGRSRPGADAATLREATLLRTALRDWPPELPPTDVRPADVAALQRRAVTDGLLQPRRRWCAGCLARWRHLLHRPQALAGAGLAFAALLLAVLLLPAMRSARLPDDDTAVLRGADATTVLLHAADPKALRDDVADALARQGVTVRRYERFGRHGLDADVPQPPAAAVAGVLQHHGIALPADGVLRVEVAPAER